MNQDLQSFISSMLSAYLWRVCQMYHVYPAVSAYVYPAIFNSLKVSIRGKKVITDYCKTG